MHTINHNTNYNTNLLHSAKFQMFLTLLGAAQSHFEKSNELFEFSNSVTNSNKLFQFPNSVTNPHALMQLSQIPHIKCAMETIAIPLNQMITRQSDVLTNFRMSGCNGNHKFTFSIEGNKDGRAVALIQANVTNLQLLELPMIANVFWALKMECKCSRVESGIDQKCKGNLLADSVYIQSEDRTFMAYHWHYILALDQYVPNLVESNGLPSTKDKQYWSCFHFGDIESSNTLTTSNILANNNDNANQLQSNCLTNNKIQYNIHGMHDKMMAVCVCSSGNLDSATQLFSAMIDQQKSNPNYKVAKLENDLSHLLSLGLSHAAISGHAPIVDMLQSLATKHEISLQWNSVLIELFYRTNWDPLCHKIVLPKLFEMINTKLWSNRHPHRATMHTIVTILKQFYISDHLAVESKWISLVEWYLQHTSAYGSCINIFEINDVDRQFLTGRHCKTSKIMKFHWNRIKREHIISLKQQIANSKIAILSDLISIICGYSAWSF